jgi:hypothetical protein
MGTVLVTEGDHILLDQGYGPNIRLNQRNLGLITPLVRETILLFFPHPRREGKPDQYSI